MSNPGPARIWPLRGPCGFHVRRKILSISLAEGEWRFSTHCVSTGLGLNGNESVASEQVWEGAGG